MLDPKLVSAWWTLFRRQRRFHTKIGAGILPPPNCEWVRMLLNPGTWSKEANPFPRCNSNMSAPRSIRSLPILSAHPRKVVVVTTFHIDLEAGGGDMHILSLLIQW